MSSTSSATTGTFCFSTKASEKTPSPWTGTNKAFKSKPRDPKDPRSVPLIGETKGKVLASSHPVDMPVAPSVKDLMILDGVGLDHNFWSMVFTGFCLHHNVTLDPNDMWLLILQGTAMILDYESRNLLENGKITLNVEVDNDADIETFISKISRGIEANVSKGLLDVWTPNFSTTTSTDVLVALSTLMYAYKNAFNYRSETLCGIPVVNLAGTLDDWKLLQSKVGQLCGMDCMTANIKCWLTVVFARLGYINELISKPPGHEAYKFFSSMVKVNNQSGGPVVNGWLLEFAPVIRVRGYDDVTRQETQKKQLNSIAMDGWVPKGSFGIETYALPVSILEVPYTHRTIESGSVVLYNNTLHAGFLGYRYDSDIESLRTVSGVYAVQGPCRVESEAEFDTMQTAKTIGRWQQW